MCVLFSQATPNTSMNLSSTQGEDNREEKDMELEQGDDNQENIEVSYSTHLRERENIPALRESICQRQSEDHRSLVYEGGVGGKY